MSDPCNQPACDVVARRRGMCSTHYFRWLADVPAAERPSTRPTPSERFWRQVDKGTASGCWVWTGYLYDGYGRLTLKDGRRARQIPAHRWAYEELVAPIPVGLQIDHLCRNRACVNPAHLEPVTPQVNCLRGAAPSSLHARKTHCPYGHPYDETNTFVNHRGSRECWTCIHARRKRSAAA